MKDLTSIKIDFLKSLGSDKVNHRDISNFVRTPDWYKRQT